MIKTIYTLIFAFLIGQIAIAQTNKIAIASPNKQLQVEVWSTATGKVKYSIKRKNETVLAASDLGLIRNDADFTNLSLVTVSKNISITDRYQMPYNKKALVNYNANQKVIKYINKKKQAIEIVFQVTNDAVAFKYRFPEQFKVVKEIKEELSSFNFPLATKTWLQTMQVSKSGWEQTNPAYEEHYNTNVDIANIAENKTGWVYPALFKVNNNYLLITEAGLDSTYCATRLISSLTEPGVFKIGFPDPREIFPGKALLPQVMAPFSSPWRVITIGDLATIVESTAGTDFAKPSQLKDIAYVKPGKASWSWINSKDDFIIYSEQKKYIDFAADMNWQYCLIDADWDRKIGYEKIAELSAYANTKNVGLLLWYNSAGDWNTVKYTPKNLLLTQKDRFKEFARLKEIGIKGVKIDFFGGDGQSVIKYYIDILDDAAKFGLMVNFHGATLPRGWARTYPNLLTVEAVRGFENVTFNQKDADREAEICTVLPFTRNAFDPMDYTPMNLFKIPTNVKRKTSSAFQLALSVVFLSGIQHFAESPEGMKNVTAGVKDFLRELPVKWDEVKFLDGFPGQYAVIARRAGAKWYIAGINNKTEQAIKINPSLFGKQKATLYTDGKESGLFDIKTIDLTKQLDLTLATATGFVLVLE
jgi:alpha-glucosidase